MVDLVATSMRYVPGNIKLANIIDICLLLATIGFESTGVLAKGALVHNLFTRATWPAWTALGSLIVIAVLNFCNVPVYVVV
jgi:xanthine/uracil/vitamin C permease (AzgA family)